MLAPRLVVLVASPRSVRLVTAAVAALTPISAWSMLTLYRLVVKPMAAVRTVMRTIPMMWRFFLLNRSASLPIGRALAASAMG